MKLTTVTCKPNFRLAVTGDWHVGGQACYQEGITCFVKRIKKLKIPWIGLGDMLECIVPGDVRFSVDDHGKLSFLGSWAWAANQIREINKTCIGILGSNHEAKLSRAIGDITNMLCNASSVPYLTQTAFLLFNSSTKPLTIFCSHGNIAMSSKLGYDDRRITNFLIRLRDSLRPFYASVKLVGHGHRAMVDTPKLRHVLQPDFNRGKAYRKPIEYVDSWCAMCPSMYKVYGPVPSYAEAAMLEPSDLGWLELIIENGKCAAIEHRNEHGQTVKEWTPVTII